MQQLFRSHERRRVSWKYPCLLINYLLLINNIFMNTWSRIAPNVRLNTLFKCLNKLKYVFNILPEGCLCAVELLYWTLFGELSMATYRDCGPELLCTFVTSVENLLDTHQLLLLLTVLSWPNLHICHHYYMCLYHILAINCCHWPPLVSCPSCHMLTVVQISLEEGDMFHKITLSFHPILAILVGQASLISSHFYWISSALPATRVRNSLKLVWEPRLIWLQEFPRSVAGSIIVQWSRHH